MNYLAFYPEEVNDESAILTGERVGRVRRIHSIALSKSYKAVIIGLGHCDAEVRDVNSTYLKFDLRNLEVASPEPEIDMVVGVCRPQTVRKVLAAAVSFAVANVTFVGSSNSEKSYFNSKLFSDAKLRQRLVLEAIEQTGSVVLPRISLESKFKIFFEDKIFGNKQSQTNVILADGAGGRYKLPEMVGVSPSILVLGPEKGWSDFEYDFLKSRVNFSHSLGPRMLRVETACVAMLSRLRTG